MSDSENSTDRESNEPDPAPDPAPDLESDLAPDLESDPRIESYLSRVAEHLGAVPEDERALILQSVEDHIRDALSEQARRLPPEQAVAVVIAMLSPPESYEPADAPAAPAELPNMFSILCRWR